MLNFLPLAFATFMASIDVVALGWLKNISTGTISNYYLPAAMAIYGAQPLLFLQSLKYETMTVMNILWDLTSDVLVTITGVLYFKEKISPLKQVALLLSFIAIVLFSYDEWTGN